MRYYNGIRTYTQSLPQQLFQKFEDKNKPTTKSKPQRKLPKSRARIQLCSSRKTTLLQLQHQNRRLKKWATSSIHILTWSVFVSGRFIPQFNLFLNLIYEQMSHDNSSNLCMRCRRKGLIIKSWMEMTRELRAQTKRRSFHETNQTLIWVIDLN